MRIIDREQVHKDFGEYIAEARRRQKLFQADLADRVGISQSYLSRMERGEREIDLPIALLLCDALDVKLDDFMKRYM